MKKMFSQVMEFDTINSPFEYNFAYPFELWKLGFNPPYYNWGNSRIDPLRNPTEPIYDTEQSIEKIKNKILSDGPYDGLSGFS